MTTKKTTSTHDYNSAKLTELFLYVASQLLGNPRNGSIKINKILFFSDNLAYRYLGNAITGVDYVRNQFGPTPKGILDIQQRLIKSGEADISIIPGGVKSQKILFPKRAPDLSIFSASEIKLVDAVIEQLSDKSAEFVSELSHELDGWQTARQGEVIPYEAIFLDSSPLTESDLSAAKALEERLGKKIDERVGART
jgi:hypothetical protein